MPERRRHVRGSIVLRGTLLARGQSSVISCTVIDISESGARLETADPAGLPEKFDLLIHAPDGAVQRKHCKIAWKTAKELGVSFA